MAKLLSSASKTFIGLCLLLVLMYAIFVVALSQGIALAKASPIDTNNVIYLQQTTNKAPLLSALFLHHDVVVSDGVSWVVLEKQSEKNKAIALPQLLLNTLHFSSIPLIFLAVASTFLAVIISLRYKKKVNTSLNNLNMQIDTVLNHFSLMLPKVEAQSPVSRLSHALAMVSERIEFYKHESESNIFQDRLTGLSDRHIYLAHLEEQLEAAQKNGKSQALLFIDLDGFKQVNDSFGHSFGDEVLVQVAERLRTVMRSHNLSHTHPAYGIDLNLSRLGGDEFSIFIDSIDMASRTVDVAQHVLREIERDFILGNKVIKIGASIGIATYPESASTPYALLQMADVAMYRAKTDGRGIFRVYSPEMGNKIRRYHYLLEEMRLALGSQNFSLSFQPIVHVKDCSIDYFEALVRWHHPIEGSISPAEFIPIAEESNLILELGDWIMNEAVRQMSAWYNAGMRKVKISVNVSGVQLKHRPIDTWVKECIERVGLPPTALMLEITESCFIEASESTIQQLENLRALGVTIAIDDFGTGFSSLQTLAELPVDVIKIDKIFIDQANNNPKYNKILHSISELGSKLGLKIVAEGVEVAEQFELVKSLGVQCIQGYLVSRPESSRTVGSKVLSNSINQVAMTGTNIWLPEQTNDKISL